jgi:hypothetical protein
VSEPKDKDTFVVRFEYQIVVKSGDKKVVEEAARVFQEAMLPPILTRTVDKLDAPAETRMRVKMQDGTPMFYRMPLIVDTVEDLAKLDAEPTENAKVKGSSGEGYVYRPDVQPGADGLDLRYTVTSRGPKGGVWIEVEYLRRAATQAQQRHAEHLARQNGGAQGNGLGARGGRR